MGIMNKIKRIAGIITEPEPKELPKDSKRIDNSEEKHKAIEQAYKKIKKK
jgi:hypothetical protein